MTLSHRIALASLIFLPALAQAEGLLNIVCTGDNASASIALNGADKGTCLGDTKLFLAPGTYTLTARKAVDAEHERFFEQKIQLSSDQVQRITLQLSAPQLTPAAQAKRQDAELRAAAQQRQEQLQQDLRLAEAGDATAIQTMIRRFTQGDGVAASPAKANAWKERLQTAQRAAAQQADERAQAGDVQAMRELASYYRTGQGVVQNTSLAESWEAKANQQETSQNAQKKAQDAVDQFSFFNTTGSFFKSDFVSSVFEGDNMLYITTSIYPVSASSMVAVLTDVIALPFNMTSYYNLKSEAQGHAAAWQEPDSLMARAYAQHKTHAAQNSTHTEQRTSTEAP